ncbi:MAG: hypothetical protein IKJ37_01275 [Kiritimatiellae bacterium]|nr:hypothetical protein [Kiritimatiellia bacterium]
MKKSVLAVVASISAFLFASSDETLSAAWFVKDISCKVGTPLAGYGPNDISVEKLDDLQLHGLALDDGRTKTLLMSFDLVGMNADLIRRIRHACAEILGVKDQNVMLSCTHTHGGPHTRRYSKKTSSFVKSDSFAPAEDIDDEYVAFLEAATVDAVKRLVADGKWRDCRVGFFSSQCDENRNRRYTTVENCASFNAHRRALHKLTTGIADKELGTVALLDATTYEPLYVIGNYAAHPLASHAPGRGGLRITSDFPGFYRRYVERETGATAMFVSGACGDLVPKDDELGVNAARKVGENLAMASVAAIIDIKRNDGRFVIQKPRLGASIVTMESRLRAPYRKMFGRDTEKMELQVLSIGDIAFLGVPGELANELGLEIKWHSPFKRTFIAYCATDYFGYISTLNQVAAGGYEPQSQYFASRDTLRLVATAQDALLSVRSQVFPEDSTGEDPYPDNLALPLVNLPGGVKASKWQRGTNK